MPMTYVLLAVEEADDVPDEDDTFPLVSNASSAEDTESNATAVCLASEKPGNSADAVTIGKVVSETPKLGEHDSAPSDT